MKIVSLSHIICGDTPLYRGQKGICFSNKKSLGCGDSTNQLSLKMPAHCSTHVDVPYHFFKNGKTITDYAPSDWVFNNVWLIKIIIKKAWLIETKDLMPHLNNLRNCDLLLIKTGFERHRKTKKYWKESLGLHPEAATFLKKRFAALRGIGVDFISISSPMHRQEGHQAHKNFLSGNILIFEDMKLSTINNAPKRVMALPLLIEKGDGAPVNIFAFV